jgi:hypothetical protein
MVYTITQHVEEIDKMLVTASARISYDEEQLPLSAL